MNKLEKAALVAEFTYKGQRAEGYSVLFSFFTALAIARRTLNKPA
jgi:hypothetical protein